MSEKQNIFSLPFSVVLLITAVIVVVSILYINSKKEGLVYSVAVQALDPNMREIFVTPTPNTTKTQTTVTPSLNPEESEKKSKAENFSKDCNSYIDKKDIDGLRKFILSKVDSKDSAYKNPSPDFVIAFQQLNYYFARVGDFNAKNFGSRLKSNLSKLIIAKQYNDNLTGDEATNYQKHIVNVIDGTFDEY